MFFEFKHGGHALAKGAAGGVEQQPGQQQRGGPQQGWQPHGWGWPGAGWRPGGWPPRVVTPEQAGDDFDPDSMTPFRYLFETDRPEDMLPVSVETVRALDKLGEAMIARPPLRPDDDPNTDTTDRQDQNPDSTLPPIFTYWSQFIDHELTARTDRDEAVSDITVDDEALKPVERARVEYALLNRRTPALELDCVYGDGPPGQNGWWARRARGRNIALARKMRDGAKMWVGKAEVVVGALKRPDGTDNPDAGKPVGALPPPMTDLDRDLPRIGTLLELGAVAENDFPESLRASKTFKQRAFIGDPRNDENLVVAQFHVAMLRFHNAVVDWLRFKDPGQNRRGEEELFEDARKIVRWTFQWLTVNQFLKTLLRPDVVERVLGEGAPLYRRQLGDTRGPYMPVEFSVACYRFGHSMIRNVYDYNRNFGRKEGQPGQPDSGPGFVLPNASLNLFFLFTGKSPTPFDPSGGRSGGPPPRVLPHNWIIEWDRFDGTSPHDAGDGQPARFARKIDTHLAPRLGNLSNEGEDGTPNDRVSVLLKQLARRNLRRGYQLSLPTGQAMARALGVPELGRDELARGNSPDMDQAMQEGGFFERTPLWFYVLKEAEVRQDGQRLGEVGSRVVAETFIGVLLADPESYLAQSRDWTPSQPVPGAGGPIRLKDGRTIETIHDLLEFAGVSPPAGAGA